MNNTWINERKHSYCAQHGEDGIIEAILERLPDRDRWGVEFGGWDGLYNSNIRHFILNDGMKGVFIEGNPVKAKEILTNYEGIPDVHSICSFVQPSGESSLDNLLKQTPIPKNFDLCIIDIDGNDYHVWEGVDEYQPKVVAIEFNPTIPNDVDHVQPFDPNLNHGNSPKALIRLAKEKGYELVATNIMNCFFVKEEYFPLYEIEDNSIHTLRNDLSKVTYIFNGYDGTILLAGSKKVFLNSIEYSERRMQIFPKYLRGFNSRRKFRQRIYKYYRSLKKRGII